MPQQLRGKLLHLMKPNSLAPSYPLSTISEPSDHFFGRAAEISSLILDSFVTVTINPLGVLCKMGDSGEGESTQSKGKASEIPLLFNH